MRRSRRFPTRDHRRDLSSIRRGAPAVSNRYRGDVTRCVNRPRFRLLRARPTRFRVGAISCNVYERLIVELAYALITIDVRGTEIDVQTQRSNYQRIYPRSGPLGTRARATLPDDSRWGFFLFCFFCWFAEASVRRTTGDFENFFSLVRWKSAAGGSEGRDSRITGRVHGRASKRKRQF